MSRESIKNDRFEKPALVSGAELESIIELHQKWLKGDTSGEQANFEGKILKDNMISNKDLSKIIFDDCFISDQMIFLQVDFTGSSFKNVLIASDNKEGGDDFRPMFIGCNFTDCDFTDAVVRAVFDDCIIDKNQGGDFSKAEIFSYS